MVQSPPPRLDTPNQRLRPSQWLLDHTALLNQTKAEWEERGYDVYTEAQNSFQLRGRTAILVGRPDLIVDRDDNASIIDVKTGQEQP